MNFSASCAERGPPIWLEGIEAAGPGMRERAKLIGGKLAVWSEVDLGAEVEVRIPAYTIDLRGSLLARTFAGKARIHRELPKPRTALPSRFWRLSPAKGSEIVR